MDEPPKLGARFRRRAPRGLLGMLALVVLVEGALAGRGMDFLDMDDWAYQRNDRWAGREGARADVLVFGDSLMKYGVLPEGLNARSGRKAFNLALPGGQAPASYVLLERAFEGGARPSAVVVDFAPKLLSAGPRHNLDRWASLLRPAEAVRLAWSAGDAGFFARVEAGRLLPSVRGRSSIRANALAALAGPGDWRRWMNAVTLRNWLKNGGAQLMPASPTVPKLTAEEIERYRAGFYGKMECHPVNAEAVDRFLSLASSRGVPVYWVLPPVVPALRARTPVDGFDADHEAFLKGWQARYPNLVVVDGRSAVPDPASYYDPNHLSARGAYAFSLGLGDVLRKTLPVDGGPAPRVPPTRWVAVPPCPTVALPEGLEDIEASRLALQRPPSARR